VQNSKVYKHLDFIVMEILYLSSLTSDHLFSEFFEKGWTTGYVGQKYHGMFVKGLEANLDNGEITVLSTPPVRHFFIRYGETQGKVRFRYVPLFPVPVLKQVLTFLYSFFYALWWCLKNVAKKKIVVCSLMRIYQFLPVLWISSLFRCKTVTVVCDIPWMTINQVSEGHVTNKQKAIIKLGRKVSSKFDGYVFLTESMNGVINTNNKPYIVIEGFCDIEMKNVSNSFSEKENKNVVIYAGGVNRKYGIKNLIDAVVGLDDVELWIYGVGDLSSELEKEHPDNVVLKGPRSNSEVVLAETKAMMLVNPRPTDEEYTNYSFPSKTLEYMSSGTFTLSTRLGGIPEEYFNHLGIIEDYSSSGIRDTIITALAKGREELHKLGMKAKSFVLDNKNNFKQGEKIIYFFKELIK
jgi:glycosyltransferase involved in cell wall biosynthesis